MPIASTAQRPSAAATNGTARTRPVVSLQRCDPPPTRHQGGGILGQILAVVDEMAEHPGVWFKVATWPGRSSAGSTRNVLKTKGPAGFEWQPRCVDGGSALWGRATR